MAFTSTKNRIAALAILSGAFSLDASACFVNCSTAPPTGQQVNTTVYNDHDLSASEVTGHPYIADTQWTNVKTSATKNWMFGQYNTWSPAAWNNSSRALKYNGGPYFVSHRGLVDLKAGIAENTLDAVANAMNNEINMVEIDVQVTKDGVPVALHDNTLRRVLNDSRRVDEVNYSEIALQPVHISEPSTNYRTTTPQLCAQGNTIMSLDRMFRATYDSSLSTELSSAQGQCSKASLWDVSFTWDPKNAKAAQATIQWIGSSAGEPSRPGDEDMVMKVYPNFYPTNLGFPNRADWDVADLFAPFRGAHGTNRLHIMPVVPAMSMIDQGFTEDEALWYAESIVKDWGQYFEVLTVEVPQAKDQQWVSFAQKLNTRLANLPNSALPFNGGYKPRASVGYRFADFAKQAPDADPNAPLSDKYESASAYDWSMEGGRQIDNGIKKRRRIAGQLAQYGPLCNTSKGCYIVHDYPLQEIGRWRVANAASPKFKYSTVQVDPIHNAPATNIAHDSVINVDGFCSGGFECTADEAVFINRDAIAIP